jgi:cullin 1
MSKITTFEEGWDLMLKGINKLKNILEGFPERFTSEEYTVLYSYVFIPLTENISF